MTVASYIKLQQRNIRSADFYHIDGMYHFRCYDLTQFGSEGADVVTREGKRYAWIVSPDHPDGFKGWGDGQAIYAGYSNDPGVPPETFSPVIPAYKAFVHSTYTGLDAFFYHAHYLVYNPDDAAGKVFYLYCEASDVPGVNQMEHYTGVARSDDLITWELMGASHERTPQGGFTSFHYVERVGTGDWFSIGFNYGADPQDAGQYLGFQTWSSTDGLTFTADSLRVLNWAGHGPGFVPPDFVTGKQMVFTSCPMISVSSTTYGVFYEDARHNDEDIYITLAPLTTAACLGPVGLAAFSSPYMINDSGTPAMERLTEGYAGKYPSSDFANSVSGYAEDGIYHFWVAHGYFSNEANPGDGPFEQWYDYYTFVYDSTAAADAAPVGVKAECRYGCVILSWYDALPHRNYRVYRSTDGVSYSSLGDVTGLKYVDPLGASVNAVRYYKVVTRNGGADQGERIVKTYVSNGRELTNRHMTRILAASATDYDVAYIDACVGWLTENGLIDECLYWADPSFGVVRSGTAISKVFCLGSTIHPRGGDYTPKTPASTTYSATGMNGTVPAWTNGSSSAHGYFGGTRAGNIRRKTEITFGAVYDKTSSSGDITLLSFPATVLGAPGNTGWIYLGHTDGTPGLVTFENLTQTTSTQTATVAPASATAPNIAIGTNNITNVIAYVNGTAGTPVTGAASTLTLDGSRSNNGAIAYFLMSGSIYGEYTLLTGARTYSNNQAGFACSTLFVFDRALSPTRAKSLYTFLNSRIGGASYALPSYSTPFVANIKDSPYSAAGDGSTDDAAAFAAFKTAVDTWQGSNTGLVVLYAPAGTYPFIASTGVNFTKGIVKFLMLGDNRELTFLNEGSGGGGFFLGTSGSIRNDNTHSVRAPTMTAGDTSVTLSDASLFSTGDWVLIAGVDLQGGGYPNNPYFFEYRQVTKSGSTLTFNTPLENTYKSTWPLYYAGAAGEIDQGGPATIYQLLSTWDMEHEYVDFAMDQGASAATQAMGRFVTLTRCKATTVGFWPSVNEVFRAYDLEHPPTMEVDKITKKAIFDNGLIHQIHVQSASVDELVLRGGVIIESGLNGTGKNLYADGFFIDGGATFSPTSYGVSERITLHNGSIIHGSGAGIGIGGFSEPSLVAGGYTMSGGVISRISRKSLVTNATTSTSSAVLHFASLPSNLYFGLGVRDITTPAATAVNPAPSVISWDSGAGTVTLDQNVLATVGSGDTIDFISNNSAWAVPGATILWTGVDIMSSISSFTITDIAESSGNILITTNLAGGFPAVAGTLGVRVHPVPIFTMRGVSGYITGGNSAGNLPDVIRQGQDYSGMDGLAAIPPAVPLYSRSSRHYNGLCLDQSDDHTIWGKLVSLTVNVLTAYSGAQSTLFLNPSCRVLSEDGTFTLWQPFIDLETTGTRVITPSGVTGTAGADAGLTFPSNPGWIGDIVNAYPTHDVSAENPHANDVGPFVDVTYVMDQSTMDIDDEAPAFVVKPMRLRLHA